MKKFNLFLVLFISAFTIFLTSCSSDDNNDGGGNSSPSKLIEGEFEGKIGEEETSVKIESLEPEKIKVTITEESGEKSYEVTIIDENGIISGENIDANITINFVKNTNILILNINNYTFNGVKIIPIVPNPPIKGDCARPAYHIQGNYGGYVNDKEATLIINAVNNTRVRATISYTNNDNKKDTRSVEFGVETNVGCDIAQIGLKMIIDSNGATTQGYDVGFLYTPENDFINLLSLESLAGEFRLISFKNGYRK